MDIRRGAIQITGMAANSWPCFGRCVAHEPGGKFCFEASGKCAHQGTEKNQSGNGAAYSRTYEELTAANNKLQEVDKLKSLFIASMSHELRTPLNSIIGFTGILLQGLAGPLNDEQRKQLGMVKGSSHHLLELITDIIDMSKIEAGKLSLSLGSFDLASTAREVLESLQPAAGRKSLKLTLEAPERLQVKSDERRVRQVLVNLIGNAVKFTPSGEVSVVIKVKTAVRGSLCGTPGRVSDRGHGQAVSVLQPDNL